MRSQMGFYLPLGFDHKAEAGGGAEPACDQADAESALLQEIITGYERSLTITENNYQAGIAARTDVLQAQSTLESARASLEALKSSRATYEHAIALLLGEPPANFSLAQKPWVNTVRYGASPRVPIADNNDDWNQPRC